MAATCDRCGTTLRFEAGACPSCLLNLGLDTMHAGLDDDAAPPKVNVSTGHPNDPLKGGEILQKYRLVRRLGEGAFGTVWEADQLHPVRRRVAVKILKLGMDSREVVARFDAERQALALMDHRSIARVFDGGLTEGGQPFFAMELVAGLPIVRYCDEHRLELRQRIELLVDVCDAVQHAHQKGVIHRDLKPANILVATPDGNPVPKVIDFGIAKAMGTELTEHTLFTRHNQILGTPAYMSPEQSMMGAPDVDTRTDIYSLGAILYELLAGQPPRTAPSPPGNADGGFNAGQWPELLRASARLAMADPANATEIAAARGTTPSVLRTLVRGELEWIAQKALDADRSLRYPSASDLARDLQRYLANEPVLAGPPSVGYRCRKFVQKHRLAVWSASAFLLLFSAAALTSIVLGLRANEARIQAEAAREAEAARRREAQDAREDLRKRNYVADIGLVQDALRANNLARSRDVLLRQLPIGAESDLRHWEWRYFWEASRIRARAILPKHQKPIRSLSASRDGRWVGWGDEIGTVGVSDAMSGQLARMLEKGAGDPAIVAFSPTTLELAAGVKRGLVKLWQAESWSERASFPQEGWTRALAFSPDGEWLVCMSDVREVSLWQPASATRLGSIPIGTLKDYYKCRLAFAPHEPILAIGETDGTIRILELPSLREQRRFRGSPLASDGITALAFSPTDGTLVSAAGYNDFSIRLWQVSDGAPLGEMTGHAGWVTALAFSPDGKVLASGSVDQTIRIWNWDTRTERSMLRGHQHEVSALTFAGGGLVLASGSRAGELFLWDLRKDEPATSSLLVEGESIRQAVFSSDSKSIITWHWNGTLSRRSVTNMAAPEPWLPLGSGNYGAALSPDGRTVAVGTRNGTLRLMDTETLVERAILTGVSNERMLPTGFTRDGRQVVGVSRVEAKPICHVWELPAGHLLKSWPLTARNHRVALSGNGMFVATGDFDGTVRLWDPQVGSEISLLGAHQSEVLGLQFSPDDRLLASGSNSGDVVLWDVRKRAALGTLRCQAGAIYSVGFSPDGRRLVTGGNWQRALQIWDLDTRQIIATLPGRGPLHDNLSFSPDGDSILSVNSEGTLQLWTAPSQAAIDSLLR